MKKDDKKEKGQKYNPNKFIELNPEDTAFKTSISEAASKTAVFAFGRFNPPTIGHEKLVNKVLSLAKEGKGSPKIYISHSVDKKKNPLPYDLKLKFMRTAFGPVVENSPAKNVIDIAKLLDSSYDNLILVVGADRKEEFENLLNKYNNKEYHYKSIEVVSAGERDPDSDDISGMSGSKMRALVLADNSKLFKEGLPKKLKSHSDEIYNELKKGMGLMEDFIQEEMEEEKQPLTQMQRRKRGLIMRRNRAKLKMAREKAKKRMATPDKLKVRAIKKARGIMRDKLMKSKKYSEMTPAEKIQLDKRLLRIPKSTIARIARKQLPLVRKAEIQRLSDLHKGDDQKESFDLNNLFEQTFVNTPDINDLFEQTFAEPKVKKKKFRYLYTREGKVNCDQRFKMFRPKQQISEEELVGLIESVEEFSEGKALERVRATIEMEKTADKNKHKRMFDRAREIDKVRIEGVDKTDPRNREYGTKSLLAILKGNTPGEESDLGEAKLKKAKDDPCWKGYAQLGMKKKGNKEVPNCVPVNESSESCPILTAAHMKAFEQFVDKMFAKYNIDFEFTKHFRERMSHERNDPCISMKELADMIKKIYAKYQHGEKSLNKFVDAEAVIKDMQTDLNMPIAVEYDRKNDELDVIAKTIMRKKNFRTPNPEIKV